MKLFKILLKITILLSAWVQCAIADPVSLNIYPTSVTVPYGASEYDMKLTFYIVSNADQVQKLSDFQLKAVSAAHPGKVKLVKFTNDCQGTLQTQKNGGVCNVYANLKVTGVAQGTSDLLSPVNYKFVFGYHSGQRPVQHMASNVFPIKFATGQLTSVARNFTFVSHCPDTVTVGIDSGAVNSITPDPNIKPVDLKSCQDSTDCYPGSTCVNVSVKPVVLNHCFWNNPGPTVPGDYQLTSSSSPLNVSFPMYDNGIDTIWNGGIAARIGCDSGTNNSCTIADCGTNTSEGGCPVGGGFQTPNSTAEFTLLGIQSLVTNTSGYPDNDTYDITVINGVTGGGLSMAPTNGVSGGTANPYKCGVPGAINAVNGLGGCDWSTTPPASPLPVNANSTYQSDYVWVGGTIAGTCTSTYTNEDCTTGSSTICGVTIDEMTAVATRAQCGSEQLGLLTADAVCAKDSTYGAPFDCNTKITENQAQYTYTEIYGCSTGDFNNSCYSKGATSACCGCQDWWNAPTYPAVIPSTKTQSCGGVFNSNWTNLVVPSLSWLKQACPTAYSYPYDDASSTFTCQVLDPTTHINTTEYTITFCPTS